MGLPCLPPAFIALLNSLREFILGSPLVASSVQHTHTGRGECEGSVWLSDSFVVIQRNVHCILLLLLLLFIVFQWATCAWIVHRSMLEQYSQSLKAQPQPLILRQVGSCPIFLSFRETFTSRTPLEHPTCPSDPSAISLSESKGP